MTPTESNFYRNGCKPFRKGGIRAVLACVFGTKRKKKTSLRMTPTESNLPRNGCEPFRLKIFWAVLSRVLAQNEKKNQPENDSNGVKPP
jgi:hypothetical protein